MLYEDPANKELLEAIHSGRAPPSLFGVRYNQPLQVMVDQKTDEDYVKPKPVTRAFGGSGNRLGSPAPEAAGSGATTPTSMPGGFGSSAGAGAAATGASGASQSGPSQATFELDTSKPSTSIQVRLGDGTK
jgi:UBX domain-containing protein 1